MTVMATFSPQIASTISVTSPSGGTYPFNERIHVTWLETAVTGNVKIELYDGNTRILPALADSVPVADRSAIVWSPSQNIIDSGSSYRLKITSLNDSSVYGYSGFFTIRDIYIGGPIQIDSYQKLQQIGSGQNGYTCTVDYVLTQDIHANSGQPFVPLCRGNAFDGTFDGAGHKIRGLQIYEPELAKVGLFAETWRGAVIQNLVFENPWVIGFDAVGVAAGELRGVVVDVHVVEGIVEYENSGGDGFGGIVGDNRGTIRNSSFTDGLVQARGGGLGGIAGWNYDTGVVEWCFVRNSEIYGLRSTQGAESVGGVVGFNAGIVRESYYEYSRSFTGRAYVGGIVGWNTGVVQDSHATGQPEAYNRSSGGASVSRQQEDLSSERLLSALYAMLKDTDDWWAGITVALRHPFGTAAYPALLTRLDLGRVPSRALSVCRPARCASNRRLWMPVGTSKTSGRSTRGTGIRPCAARGPR